jgi:hypothetical protein
MRNQWVVIFTLWLLNQTAAAEIFVNRGLCLTVDQRRYPNPVTVEKCIPAWSNQQWCLEKTTGTTIINAGTQLCLDIQPAQGLLMAAHCDEERIYALQAGQLPTQRWQIATVASGRKVTSPPVEIRSKVNPLLCVTVDPILGPTGWGQYTRLMPCTPDNISQLWRVIY